MIETEEKEYQRTKPVFNTISVFVHTQSFIFQSTQVLCTWARIYLFLLDSFSAMPQLNLRIVVLSKPNLFHCTQYLTDISNWMLSHTYTQICSLRHTFQPTYTLYHQFYWFHSPMRWTQPDIHSFQLFSFSQITLFPSSISPHIKSLSPPHFYKPFGEIKK